METGAIDVMQFDCNAHAGITEWRKVAGMASMCYIKMAPHHEPVLHGHLLASVPNGYIRSRSPTPTETRSGSRSTTGSPASRRASFIWTTRRVSVSSSTARRSRSTAPKCFKATNDCSHETRREVILSASGREYDPMTTRTLAGSGSGMIRAGPLPRVIGCSKGGYVRAILHASAHAKCRTLPDPEPPANERLHLTVGCAARR